MTDTEKIVEQEVTAPDMEQPEKKSGKVWRIVVLAVVLIAGAFAFVRFGLPAIQYSNAIKAFEAGEYSQAVETFAGLPGYKEADSYRIRAQQGVHYTNAAACVQAGDYAQAVEEYAQAGNFQDAATLMKEASDRNGEELFKAGKYVQASEAFATAENMERQTDCGIALVQKKSYSDAIAVLEQIRSNNAENYLNYAKGMEAMKTRDYQLAMDSFGVCSNLLDAGALHKEAMFQLAEKCLHEGYLNKAKRLYATLPEGYAMNGVTAADRIKLLDKNPKFVNMVGTWSATDTYYRVQADSTTSSYYYYWYQDGVNLGVVTVTCPYNDDGTFTIQGSATYPTYENFSSKASEMKTGMRTFNFSKDSKSVPYTIDSSNTTKLTFSGKRFELQYKYTNTTSNVYWHYTFTSKVKYENRSILPEDR